jgi:hypothetical protein
VQREEEDVEVVGEALHETVDGMEGVAGERRRYLPLVMRLVESLCCAYRIKRGLFFMVVIDLYNGWEQ